MGIALGVCADEIDAVGESPSTDPDLPAPRDNRPNEAQFASVWLPARHCDVTSKVGHSRRICQPHPAFASVWFRRISPVAVHPGEGPLTEPITAVRPRQLAET